MNSDDDVSMTHKLIGKVFWLFAGFGCCSLWVDSGCCCMLLYIFTNDLNLMDHKIHLNVNHEKQGGLQEEWSENETGLRLVRWTDRWTDRWIDGRPTIPSSGSVVWYINERVYMNFCCGGCCYWPPSLWHVCYLYVTVVVMLVWRSSSTIWTCDAADVGDCLDGWFVGWWVDDEVEGWDLWSFDWMPL